AAWLPRVGGGGMHKRVHPTFKRQRFATHLLEMGYDIRAVQAFPGHERLETTIIYPHVMQKGVAGTQSPLDVLDELRPEEVEAAVEATRRLERAGQPHQSEPAFA